MTRSARHTAKSVKSGEEYREGDIVEVSLPTYFKRSISYAAYAAALHDAAQAAVTDAAYAAHSAYLAASEAAHVVYLAAYAVANPTRAAHSAYAARAAHAASYAARAARGAAHAAYSAAIDRAHVNFNVETFKLNIRKWLREQKEWPDSATGVVLAIHPDLGVLLIKEPFDPPMAVFSSFPIKLIHRASRISKEIS